MPLVGLDGQEISSEKEPIKYEVGGVIIEIAETPEMVLQKALLGAQQLVAQQVGQMALQKTGSHMVAQTEAQAAASKVNNPFQIEPGAFAIFMLMSREIEHRDRVIEGLSKRLDALDGKSSEDLLKKSWTVEVSSDEPSKDEKNDSE